MFIQDFGEHSSPFPGTSDGFATMKSMPSCACRLYVVSEPWTFTGCQKLWARVSSRFDVSPKSAVVPALFGHSTRVQE